MTKAKSQAQKNFERQATAQNGALHVEQTVQCTVSGLEEVEVTYDLSAKTSHLMAFMDSLGTRALEHVVIKIEGLPEEYDGPLDTELPFVFRLWLAGKGLIQASAAYKNDPNS